MWEYRIEIREDGNGTKRYYPQRKKHIHWENIRKIMTRDSYPCSLISDIKYVMFFRVEDANVWLKSYIRREREKEEKIVGHIKITQGVA